MKSCLKVSYLLGIWGLILVVAHGTYAQSITFTTPALNTTAVCYGGKFQLGFTLAGFTITPPNTGVQVNVLLSDATGSFSSPINLTSRNAGNGIRYEILSLENWRDVLPAGTGYRIKLCAGNVCSNPSEAFAIAPENGFPITADAEFRVRLQNGFTNGPYICRGKPAVFEVRNWGQAAIQWYKDGVVLAGETGNVLSTTLVGMFTVRATKAGCATTEEDIGFTRVGRSTPEPVNISGSTTINQNQTATLTLTRPSPTTNSFGGYEPIRIYLSDYTFSEEFPLAWFGTSTTKTILVKPGKTTAYSIKQVSTDCGYMANPGSGTATVTVNTGGNDLRIAVGALPATTLCTSDYTTVPFSTTGTFQNQNGSYNFRVAITDATGQYDQLVDGFVDEGGIRFYIPNTMYGSGFRLRVISTSPYVASNYSVPFTIRQPLENVFIEPDRPPTLCSSTGATSVKLTARVIPYGQTTYSQPGLTYQWMGPDGLAIAGATSQTYVATQRGLYQVIISNGCQTTENNPPIINIYGPEVSPQLVLSGRNPICQAEVATFYDRPTITAPSYYSPDARYTWTRNGVFYTKGEVSGNSTYRAVTPLRPTESGQYGLTVDHLGCPVTFPPVSITVLPSPTVTITPQPNAVLQTLYKCGAEPLVLTGTVSGSGITDVQWLRYNDTVISTTNSFTATNTTLANYQFRALPIPEGCTNPIQKEVSVVGLTTSVAQLTATVDLYPEPHWELRLQATKPVGLTAYNFTVQWYRNGQPFDANTTIETTYNSTILNASLLVEMPGVYTARVTTLANEQYPTIGCTGDLSNPISLSALPERTYSLFDFSYSVSGLTVTLTPNKPLTSPNYYVRNYPAGTDGMTITSPYTFTQAGTYQILVGGYTQDGTYEDAVKWVNVNNCSVVPFTISPGMTNGLPIRSCSNNPLTLSVPAGLTSYTWIAGTNSPIAGATINSYTVAKTDYSLGEYKVEATGPNGCKYTSNSVIVRFSSLPDLFLSVAYWNNPSGYVSFLNPSSGGFAYLKASSGNTRPIALTISSGLSGTTRPAIYGTQIWEAKVSPTKTTTYSLVAASNECGTTTFSPAVTATVEVESEDVSLTLQASRTAVSVGQEVVFTVTPANAAGYQSAVATLAVALPVNFSFVGSATLELVYGQVVLKPPYFTGSPGVSLPSGASVPLSFTARAIANGNALVQAQITSSSMWDVDSQPNSGYTDGQDDAASVLIAIGTCSSMVSLKSGSWIDPTVWSCGRIPIAGDVVTVASGHVVTISTGVIGVCKALQQQGQLVLTSTGRLRLGQN